MSCRRIIRGHLPCTNLFRQAGNDILMLAVVKKICRLKRVPVQIKELALVLNVYLAGVTRFLKDVLD